MRQRSECKASEEGREKVWEWEWEWEAEGEGDEKASCVCDGTSSAVDVQRELLMPLLRVRGWVTRQCAQRACWCAVCLLSDHRRGRGCRLSSGLDDGSTAASRRHAPARHEHVALRDAEGRQQQEDDNGCDNDAYNGAIRQAAGAHLQVRGHATRERAHLLGLIQCVSEHGLSGRGMRTGGLAHARGELRGHVREEGLRGPGLRVDGCMRGSCEWRGGMAANVSVAQLRDGRGTRGRQAEAQAEGEREEELRHGGVRELE